jgi:Methylamine utilisation protein MauE
MIDNARLVTQLAIGLVFLFSTPAKLLDPRRFARGITLHQILPTSLSYGIGMLLIPVEVFLSISHLSGWLLSIAAPFGLVVFASFATGIAINLKRGRALACFCFGGSELISTRTLIRTLLLLLGELLLLADPDLFNTDHIIYPHKVATVSDVGLAFFWATFLVLGGFWILNSTMIIDLFRPWPTCGNLSPAEESGSVQEQSNPIRDRSDHVSQTTVQTPSSSMNLQRRILQWKNSWRN